MFDQIRCHHTITMMSSTYDQICCRRQARTVSCNLQISQRGSHQIFVHPPINPTGRLPSKNADRLGPARVSYNCYKTSKQNFSTHTFSMGVAKGGFSGMCSTTIACKRRWDIAFGEDDVVRESLCSNKRLDIKPPLQIL